ncbi:hypothetical protein O4H61_08065 [Roseovarius aestuarii]|nr:hypothetical protein [Roseovarius aestuarii]
MGALALLALFSGLMMSMVNSSDDDDLVLDGDEEPETPQEPEDPDVTADAGATFAQTEEGVELELGEDETGSLAVIYYEDTEDNPDDFYETQEARFYLVPEGVDFSAASWETRNDVPGADQFDGAARAYELPDFEEQFGLKLLGVVNLKDIPVDEDDLQGDDLADRVGVITANAPVAGYYLTATTDSDQLVEFLPEDYVITRFGMAELPVSVDTTGTDGRDWLSADADGITVSGAGGDDILETDNAGVTLIGDAGDDVFESRGADVIIDGGTGDDIVTAVSATVDGGAGDDNIVIHSGSATGGDGEDYVSGYGDGPTQLYGNRGDDRVSAYGAETQAYGGQGDDFVALNNGATGYGGGGDDTLQMDAGTVGFGGNGDDTFTVWNQFRDEAGPAIITGGAGNDLIDARVWNPLRGEADDIYLRVTDFDPSEDVLQIGAFQTDVEVDQVQLEEAGDGSYTDVRITYTSLHGLPPGLAVIRLDGTTGMTADQIAIAR